MDETIDLTDLHRCQYCEKFTFEGESTLYGKCSFNKQSEKINNSCANGVFSEALYREKNKPSKKKTQKSLIKLDTFMENVEEFRQQQPFFFDKSNMFWLWDDVKKKYEMVDDVDMMNLLDDVLGLEGQTVNTKIKTTYMEAFKRIGRKNIPKDAPKKWIQFKDKAFSLSSKKIYGVTHHYFFTNPIPHNIGKSYKTPVMDKLITEWVGDKYRKTAYEIIAYCCLTDYPIHLIFCLVGIGRNGKSKFLGLINRFIGRDNVCSTELDTLLDSRFESFKLYRKLVCSMGETNFGVISKTSLLKKLTGQDLIGYEYKNKKPFDDYNYAKIIISSNSLPTTEDTSEGFYRRWMILDFPNTFPEGKDILETVPQKEYNNLVLKITNILPNLLDNAQFTNQGTIKDRRDKYVMASNPLSNFLKMACIRDYEVYMRYSELYSAYIQFLHKNNRRRISYKEFNQVLTLEGLEVQRTSKKVGEEFKSDRYINGVKLKDEWEKEANMSVMSVMQYSSLRFLYRDSEVKHGHKCHKRHKEGKLEVSEEYIGDGWKPPGS